ncbi:2512_t:CDS:1, partial [Gigaspora margarita]
PNATPDSMNIIMRFLYGADFKIPTHNTRTLLNTFLLANEMRIMELRDVLKSYFTENIIAIMEDLELINMIILHDDMKKILLKKMCLKPELLFNFENQQIPENIFYELISMSELRLEEHKLLNRVIQYWSDTNGFPDKKYLINCIRFNQITIGEIKDVIRKFKRKQINTGILDEVNRQYESYKNSTYNFRDGNFCLESELLDLEIAKMLITWISGGKNHHECWYKFELLFNLEHNGLKSETFHINCDGKGPTIVIIKLYENDNLIDGYNPLDWEGKNGWKKTRDSFLFKFKVINGYSYKKSNIKPGFEEKAIGCKISNGPMFGTTDLYIQSCSKYCNLIPLHYESLNMSGDYLMKSYEILRVIKQR